MFRTAPLVRFVALACVGATLAACSGGGESEGSTTSPASGNSTSGSAPSLVSSITPPLATAMADAARAITAVTSYDYHYLDASHDAAVRYLADPFRSKYESAWAQVLAQAPKTRAVVAGKIDNVGVSDVAPDRVSVLVFSQQTIREKSTPQPRQDLHALQVTMTFTAGSWLLSELGELDPTSAGDNAQTAWAASELAAAVLVGRQCATAIYTLDARTVDTQLTSMLQCTTGDLHASLQAGQGELRQAAAKSSLTSTVIASGISSAAADRVELLVALAAKSTPRSGSPTNRLDRLVLTLQQDGGQWLVAKAEPVR